MRRILTILAIGAVFCLFVPLAVAEKPSKPGGGGGGGGHNGGGSGGGSTPTTQNVVIAGQVSSDGAVEVGIDVNAYSGEEIPLYLGPDVLEGQTDVAEGSYWGYARLLKARTSSRFDFFFRRSAGTCVAPAGREAPSCDYRLILEYGLFDRKADTVTFDGSDGAEVTLVDSTTGEYLLGDGRVGVLLSGQVTITPAN
jgi:hypothetical protein